MSSITLLNAYQKIGAEVEGMTTSQALAHAGLTGWNQRLLEPIVMDGTTEVDHGKHRYNVADLPIAEGITGPIRKTSVLGAVLASYKPIQNEEAFLPLIDSLKDGGLAVSTVGAYDGGKAAFACFKIPTVDLGGEQIGGYLVATKRNDGGGSMKATVSKERIWCANQLSGLARKARPEISIRHTRNADPFLMQQAEVLLGLTSEWDRALAAEIERLQKVTVTKQDYIKRVVPAVLKDERPKEQGRSLTIWDRKFDELVRAWDSPVHAEGNTGWRAYSAVTEWEQHHRSSNQGMLAEAAINGRQPNTMVALAAIG